MKELERKQENKQKIVANINKDLMKFAFFLQRLQLAIILCGPTSVATKRALERSTMLSTRRSKAAENPDGAQHGGSRTQKKIGNDGSHIGAKTRKEKEH